MPSRGIDRRGLPGRQAIVDMTPMIRRDGGRIDPERFDGVDDFQGALDPRPAIQLQQDFGTGMHETEGLEGLGAEDSAQDAEPRRDGSVLIPGPTDAGEDRTGGKADPSSLPIDSPCAILLKNSG